MNQSFEIRTERIPADYNEYMNIKYGSPNIENGISRFLYAGAIKSSSVKIGHLDKSNAPNFQLDDSNY